MSLTYKCVDIFVRKVNFVFINSGFFGVFFDRDADIYKGTA